MSIQVQCKENEPPYSDHSVITPVQDALDPNGILAPGKQGIWPNRFRHLRETDDAE
jgi:hypothetical protein